MAGMDTGASQATGGQVVVLDCTRSAGRKDWQELADVVLLTCAAQRPGALLLDVRRAPFTPSAREVDLLASALGKCPLVAIVAGPDVSYGRARMVATSLELRGRGAAAFKDEPEAWGWLEEHLGHPGAGPSGAAGR